MRRALPSRTTLASIASLIAMQSVFNASLRSSGATGFLCPCITYPGSSILISPGDSGGLPVVTAVLFPRLVGPESCLLFEMPGHEPSSSFLALLLLLL